MRHSTKTLVVLGLVLAISAVSPVGAYAEEAGNPLILLQAGAKFPVHYTSSGTGNVTFETWGGSKLQCVKHTGEGTLDGPRLGKITIDFSECSFGKVSCKSEGDANGVILVAATTTLVDLLIAGELKAGLAIVLPAENKVICGLLKHSLKGTAIGVVGGAESGKLTNSFTLVFLRKLNAKGEPEPGTQAIRECNLTKEFCAGKKFFYEAKFNELFEPASLESLDTFTLGALEKEISIDY